MYPGKLEPIKFIPNDLREFGRFMLGLVIPAVSTPLGLSSGNCIAREWIDSTLFVDVSKILFY
jgi:hypothetical protein